MYTEIVSNDYYELGIVGDLVCLRFKPAFDRVLGEDRGKRVLGSFNGMGVRSQDFPQLEEYDAYLPGSLLKSDSRTAAYRTSTPKYYAEKLHGALQEYIASKQPFKDGDKYWTLGFDVGGVFPMDLIWDNDEPDKRDLSLGIAFKTKEECERCIEGTKEFWRNR